MIKSIIFLFFLIFINHEASATEGLVGRVSVVDGDTLEMHGNRIRLHGIDAPESGQSCTDEENKTYRCGQLSADRMASYVSGKAVYCEILDKDRYGRLIAACSVNDVDVNQLLVSEGWALAYRQYSRDYVSAEENAKKLRLGMWRGKFVEPWKWRRGERLEATKAQDPNDCVIKGNISGSGKIYHTPSSPWYARTKINTAKGERWFCSEEEAQAAGWRAPR